MTRDKWKALIKEQKNEFIHKKLNRRLWLLGKAGFYYCASFRGYTGEIKEAGRYSEEVAKNHIKGTSGEVIAIPEPPMDYVGSLDDIEKAYNEATVIKDWGFKDRFYYNLGKIVCGERSNGNDWDRDVDYLIHAGAPERAEAFALAIEPEDE